MRNSEKCIRLVKSYLPGILTKQYPSIPAGKSFQVYLDITDFQTGSNISAINNIQKKRSTSDTELKRPASSNDDAYDKVAETKLDGTTPSTSPKDKVCRRQCVFFFKFDKLSISQILDTCDGIIDFIYLYQY